MLKREVQQGRRMLSQLTGPVSPSLLFNAFHKSDQKRPPLIIPSDLMALPHATLWQDSQAEQRKNKK